MTVPNFRGDEKIWKQWFYGKSDKKWNKNGTV